MFLFLLKESTKLGTCGLIVSLVYIIIRRLALPASGEELLSVSAGEGQLGHLGCVTLGHDKSVTANLCHRAQWLTFRFCFQILQLCIR